MADWTDIADSALDPDAPLTSDLAYAWRDNHIAIAEGASGAPYQDHIWHPFDSTSVGDSTGEIWSFAADGAVTEVETPDFEDGWEYRIRFDQLVRSGTNGVSLDLYRETSAAYAGVLGLVAAAVSSNMTGYVELLRPRDVANAHIGRYHVSIATSDSAVVSSSALTLHVEHTTAQKLLKAKILTASVQTFNSGAIYLERRKIYA